MRGGSAMAADDGRSRLGRGLAALMGDGADETAVVERARGGARRVPVSFLTANPKNPRKTFQVEALEELITSVKTRGVVQPLLVRALANQRDRYEIIAGERRWRAAQAAGVVDVPVVVLEAGDKEALELAIIENVQRADLNPLEEAAAYDELMKSYGYTQEQLASAVGKSRSHVANMIRLLGAPVDVKGMATQGQLSAGHLRAILTSPDPKELAEKIVAQGLSVRQAEALATEAKATPQKARPRDKKGDKDADTKALERALSEALGLRVEINHRGASGGRIEVTYRTLEQLDEVCRRLQQG